tara:strand:- start:2394 stop:3047 length:654 start_codon:yes stop_codon:yes gene_type:complete
MKQHDLKVVVLDFDGTLVESNKIKDQVFETIFSEWPEHKWEMMRWHLQRNAMDRREKFSYFVEEKLRQRGNIKLINQLTDKFSEMTHQAIVDCPMVQGAQTFLDEYVAQLPLFLASATPQKNLDEILKERGLEKYFKETYGAPINKVEVLKKIMSDEKVLPEEILYIGDSLEDHQAAELLGISFIGKQSDRLLNGKTNNVFTEFVQIRKYFKKKYNI